MRPIRQSGREVELIVELLQSGRYPIKDALRIRAALLSSIANNLERRVAWIRTPVRDSISRVVHCWVEEPDTRSVFRSTCRLVLSATAHELVSQYVDQEDLAGLKQCRGCERSDGRWGEPILLGELYRRTGREILSGR